MTLELTSGDSDGSGGVVVVGRDSVEVMRCDVFTLPSFPTHHQATIHPPFAYPPSFPTHHQATIYPPFASLAAAAGKGVQVLPLFDACSVCAMLCVCVCMCVCVCVFDCCALCFVLCVCCACVP